MSVPHILVHLLYGDGHIRADTAAELGIEANARLTYDQYMAAKDRDYGRNREARAAFLSSPAGASAPAVPRPASCSWRGLLSRFRRSS